MLGLDNKGKEFVDNINNLLNSSFTRDDLFNSFGKILEDYIESYSIPISSVSDCILIMSDETINLLDSENLIDWKYVSHYVSLSEKFIEKYCDRLDWMRICKYQCNVMSDNFILQHEDKVNWLSLVTRRHLSERLLDKYMYYYANDKNALSMLCQFQDLSEDFIKENFDILPVKIIVEYQRLNVDFIKSYWSKLPKIDVLRFQRGIITEEFILNYCWNIKGCLSFILRSNLIYNISVSNINKLKEQYNRL